MSTNLPSSEKEARQVAEASRETEWKEPSFLKELFLGTFRFSLIHLSLLFAALLIDHYL